MGVEKSEIKMAVAHEIGCSLDDMLESAKLEVPRWEGAKLAYREVQIKVDGLMGHLKRDVHEDKLSLEEAEIVQRWLHRCRHLAENLQLQADAMICKSKGRVDALSAAVTVTKKVYDDENRKKTALLEPEVDDGRPSARPVGKHPGTSEIQERRAKAREEKAKAEAEEKPAEEPVKKAPARKSKTKPRSQKSVTSTTKKKKQAPKRQKASKKEQVAAVTVENKGVKGPRSPHLPA